MEFKDLSEKMQQLVIEKKYAMIRDKALMIQEKGVEVCRDNDTLNFPPQKLNNQGKRIIESGVKQIINYKGLTKETAFKGLNIPEFYFFMYFFKSRIFFIYPKGILTILIRLGYIIRLILYLC